MYTCSLSQPGGCYAASGISPCLSTPTWPRVASFSCTSVLLGHIPRTKYIVSYPFPSRSLTLLSVIRILKITRTGVPFSVNWRLCPFDYDMILCSQWIPVTRGCQAHVDTFVCVTTHLPGHRPSNGRVRAFPACLLNIDYVIRRNLSCLRIIHDVCFFISILALPVLHPLWLITCTDKPFSDEWYSFSATQTS